MMQPISLAESLKIIKQHAAALHPIPEIIPTRSAIERVTHLAIFAKRSNPATSLAAMDGIAISFRSTFVLPARLKPGQWQRINTGEALDPKFNAVVKIEEVQFEKELPVLSREVFFLQNVRPPGEDFMEGQLLFPAEHLLQAQDLALLIAAGHDQVQVNRKPVVSFLPTGSELVESSPLALEGKTLESNSAFVEGLVKTWGGELRIKDAIPDDADDIAQVLKLAVLDSDIVIISAGTSKGTADLTASVLQHMGQIHFHGVSLHPAKPSLFGEIDAKPVIGLPGYPVAAYVAAQLYLQPFVSALSGIPGKSQHAVHVAAEEVPPRDVDSYHRVQMFEVDAQTYVRRIEKGASSISSLSQMDGLMHVPPNTPIHKRDGVRVEIIQDRARNSTAGTGFEDPDISYLFDLTRKEMPLHRLLFWEASTEEALQNITERSAHFAVIATPKSGRRDLFAHFEKQLQEPMERIRVFTRTVGLILPSGMEFATMPKPIALALPKKNHALWEELLTETTWTYTDFQTIPTESEEEFLMIALAAGHWQAVFGDLRFARTDQHPAQRIQEHIDLVFPESALELPVIQKLLEMVKSEEFRKHMALRTGCEL